MRFLENMKPIVGFAQHNDKDRWSFSVSVNDATYYLYVRFDAVETLYTFGKFIDGDFHELMSKDEFDDRAETIAEHEPVECDSCKQVSNADLFVVEEGEGFACKDCRSESIAAAKRWLDEHCISIETSVETRVRAYLLRHWDAFSTLFNPTYTF